MKLIDLIAEASKALRECGNIEVWSQRFGEGYAPADTAEVDEKLHDEPVFYIDA